MRGNENGVKGFYITPSGRSYSSLKPNDIIFVSLKKVFDKKKEQTFIRMEVPSGYLCE